MADFFTSFVGLVDHNEDDLIWRNFEMTIFKNISWHAKSDIGFQRKVNEDSICLPDLALLTLDSICPGFLFAVADGLGGHTGGEVASKMACDFLMDFYIEKVCQTKSQISNDTLTEALVQTYYDIDTMIRDYGIGHKTYEDMGTTLSALLVTRTMAVGAHVGDSRVYRLRREKLEQLTSDHTYVQEMVIEGSINPRDAANHPLRNALTQTVGTKEPLSEVFSYKENIEPGDHFLLCSDGLHGMVSDASILKALLAYPDTVDKTNRLIEIALARGGQDNITAIVVRI